MDWLDVNPRLYVQPRVQEIVVDDALETDDPSPDYRAERRVVTRRHFDSLCEMHGVSKLARSLHVPRADVLLSRS